MQLREYQRDLANNTWRSLKRHRSVMVQSSTGSGKTVVIVKLTEKFSETGDDRTLILAHREELISQTGNKLRDNGLDVGFIQADRMTDYSLPVQVASIQTLIRRKLPKNIKYVITDECFPKGTLIDGMPIEDIQIGDYVRSFNHLTGVSEKRKVLSKFKNPIKGKLCRITLSNGVIIVCTEGHPIYDTIRNEYIPAILLKQSNHILYEPIQSKALQSLRYNDSTYNKASKIHAQSEQSLLFDKMFKRVHAECSFRNDVENEQSSCLRTNDKQQSHEEHRQQNKDVKHSENNRSQTEDSRWQWSGINRVAKVAIRKTITTNRVHSEYGDAGQGIPIVLQNRYCEPGNKTWNRGGWFKSSINTETSSRPEENPSSGIVRVDNIEIYEPTDIDQYRLLCPEGFVYNIEVEGNNNYFVNNVLVHNCHHCTAASYRTIYSMLPEAKLLGFTATPIRTNGAGFDDIYEDMVCGPQPQELIDMGFLLQPTYRVAPLRADLSSVKKTAGDYNEKALAAVMDKSSLTGDAVREWHKHAFEKKTITFAVNVEHSKHIVERYKQAGIGAAHIDGNTPKEVRRRLFEEFKRGDFYILSNVGIATEGTDIPEVECVQMLRPTQSLSLYLQMGGRMLRPFGDQKFGICLDHSNNIFAHGFLEQDREWTLQGIKKNTRPEGDKKVMIAYQGKMYFPQDLPDEASEIHLIEMDYSSARMTDLNRLIADAERRGRKRYSAYYEFLKKYKPTPLELITFQEKLGCKKGWAYHAMKDLHYSNEEIKKVSSVIYS